jgi:hypothetical protein
MKFNDPKNYKKINVPFESLADAQTALEGFYEAIYKARNEYKIADVTVICQITAKAGDKAGHALSTAHFGDGQESEGMISYALGEVQNARRAMFENIRKDAPDENA